MQFFPFNLKQFTIGGAIVFGLFCLVNTSGCKKSNSKLQPVKKVELPARIESAEDQVVYDLIMAEDLVLDLSPELTQLAEWFQQNSTLGNNQSSPDLENLFGSLVECRGLAPIESEGLFRSEPTTPGYVMTGHWPLDKDASPGLRNPWHALSVMDVSWETIKFGVVDANFDNPAKTSFTLHTKSEGRGLGNGDSKARYGFKGHQDLTWTKVGEAWELTHWGQSDFELKKTSQPLFAEVLKQALAPNTVLTLRKAQRSYKDELLVKASKTGEMPVDEPKHKMFTSAASNYLFPSVSIVDYDNDGFDDMFLTARWGPTQMLRNLGDGTFKEVTRDIGLYYKNLVNCALFADFDNDGDKDVILGRPLEPMVYLENEDNKFREVTQLKTDVSRLYFVSGISVSDVNRDGLLDVYLSTYAPLRDDRSWGSMFLSQKEMNQVIAHQSGRNKHLDLAGPANVLLMNQGDGELKRVPLDENLAQWRRSFQSVWSDIDNDGDDDLYICNDFAPDAMLRNDTIDGAELPQFTDVTREVLLNKGIGFGMGASFGDFDRDGDLDLYVSNMFSKAGTRIIKQVKSVDPRTAAAAAGNFLFENEEGKFAQKAGASDGFYPVNQVGWSYGGQWSDFDNDGRLDLYVPSGYYTAPKEIASEVDT